MLPPQTMAIDKNGDAFERSGSITKSFPWSTPALTLQVCAAGSTVTSAPKSRSIATVISMCGIDGSAPPRCVTVIPSSILGATRRSADRNWLDALASIVSAPPLTFPRALITIGKL